MEFLSQKWGWISERFRSDPNLQRAMRGTAGHVLSMLFVLWEPLVFPGSCAVPVYHLIAAGVGAADPQLGATIRCCIVMSWGSLLGSLCGLVILSMSGPVKIASVLLMLLMSIPMSMTKLSHNVALFSVNSQMAISSVIIKSPEKWLTWETAIEFGLPPVYSNTVACVITLLTSLLIFPTSAEMDLQRELSKYVRDIGIMLTDFSSRMLSKGAMGENAAVSYTESEFLARIGVRTKKENTQLEKSVRTKGQLLRKVNVGFMRLDTLLSHMIYEPMSSTIEEWNPIVQKSKVLLDHVFVLMMSLSGFSSRLCSDESVEHWWGPMRDIWISNFGLCVSSAHVVSELISTLHKSTMSEEAHEKLLKECGELADDIDRLIGSIRNGFLQSFQNNIRRLNYVSDPTPPWELRLLYFTTFYYGKTRTAIVELANEVIKYHQSIKEKPPAMCDRLLKRSYNQLQELTEIKTSNTPHERREIVSKKHLNTLDLLVEPFRMWKNAIMMAPRDKQKAKEVIENEKVRFLLKHTIALAIIAIPPILMPEHIKVHWLHWAGVWAYVTVFLVFQKAVELTFVKGLLSILATVPGAIIGGIYLLSDQAASQPILVCLFLVPWIFLGLYFCQGVYHYGAFIFILTIPLVIGCQFDPDENVSHWSFPAARCSSIIYGCLVALLVSQFIWPYWGVDKVRQKLSTSIELIGELFELITRKYESGQINETEAEDIRNDRQIERLFSKISANLDQAYGISGKETSLITKSGAMNLPQEYKSMIESLRMLVVYLQVLHSCVSRDPVLTGTYKGNIDHLYMQPLSEHMKEIRDLFRETCKRISKIIKPRPSHGVILHFDHYVQEPLNFSDVSELQRLMHHFREARKQVVMAINKRRQEVLENWAEALSERDRKAEEMEKGRSDIRVVRTTGQKIPFHADDSLRFFAYLYAKTVTLDTLFDTAEIIFAADNRLNKSPSSPPRDHWNQVILQTSLDEQEKEAE